MQVVVKDERIKPGTMRFDELELNALFGNSSGDGSVCRKVSATLREQITPAMEEFALLETHGYAVCVHRPDLRLELILRNA